MKKKILVIMGHPSMNSLNRDIADSYIKGAKKNFQIKKIYLPLLKFDPILHEGYNKAQELEPDLKRSQEMIKWAEHIVFVYPLWWISFPALLKGFIDRTFLPGFGFKFHSGRKIDKFLTGRTATFIITTGGRQILYDLFGWIMMKHLSVGLLGITGIKLKKQRFFSEIRKSTSKKEVDEILEEVRLMGEKGI